MPATTPPVYRLASSLIGILGPILSAGWMSLSGCSGGTEPDDFVPSTGLPLRCMGSPLPGGPQGVSVLTEDCRLRLDLRLDGDPIEFTGPEPFMNFEDEILGGKAEDEIGFWTAGLNIPSSNPGTYFGGNHPDAIPGASFGWSRASWNFNTRICLDGQLELVVVGNANGFVWGSLEGVACDFVGTTVVGGQVDNNYRLSEFSGTFVGQFSP